MSTTIYAWDFDSPPSAGSNMTAKPTTTAWAHSSTKSGMWAGDYAYYGEVAFAASVADYLDVTFWIYQPSASAGAGNLRVVGFGYPGFEILAGLDTGRTVVGFGHTGVMVDVGAANTAIQLRCVADRTASKIYVNGSSTEIGSWVGLDNVGTFWNNGASSVEFFHSGTDNYTGATTYFYVDDITIVTGTGSPFSAPPPPAPPPDFWTGFVSCHETI